jgi:hypothetical protein
VQDRGETLEMPDDAVNVPLLAAAVDELNSALNNPFFGAL